VHFNGKHDISPYSLLLQRRTLEWSIGLDVVCPSAYNYFQGISCASGIFLCAFCADIMNPAAATSLAALCLDVIKRRSKSAAPTCLKIVRRASEGLSQPLLVHCEGFVCVTASGSLSRSALH
jgi:hypothetical protein